MRLSVRDIKKFKFKDGSVGLGVVVDKILSKTYEVVSGKYVILYIDGVTEIKEASNVVESMDVNLSSVQLEVNEFLKKVSSMQDTVNSISDVLTKYNQLLVEQDKIKDTLQFKRSLYSNYLDAVSSSLVKLNSLVKCSDVLINCVIDSLLYNRDKISNKDLKNTILKYKDQYGDRSICAIGMHVLNSIGLKYKIKHTINLSDIGYIGINLDNRYKIKEIPTIMYLHRILSDKESKGKLLYLYVDGSKVNVKLVDTEDRPLDPVDYNYVGKFSCDDTTADTIYTLLLNLLSK